MKSSGEGALCICIFWARAFMWWNIAASQGTKEAAVNLGMVQNEMTPAQIEKAQKLVRECVAKNYKGC